MAYARVWVHFEVLRDLRVVGSFDQLLGLFSNDLAVPGAWFYIPANQVFDRSGKRFSEKDGLRPCLLAEVPGPNALVYTRSASCKGGIEHALHVHPEGRWKCGITKNGWVKKIPVVVDPLLFTGDNLSCLDPDGPSLLAKLGSRGSSV